MTSSHLWLDLFLCPTRTVLNYFKYAREQSSGCDANFLQYYLEKVGCLGCHADNPTLTQWLLQAGQGFIPYPELPERLRQIDDPPAGLLYQGDPGLLEARMIAVVGARKQTPAGAENCRHFAYRLAQSGLAIISGLARGADASAHRACLDAKGKTIAVLGQGMNHVYPVANESLQMQIRHDGLVISEYTPDQPVRAWQFPHRNRLISGLAEGVLVTEAALKSGSLVTARCAAEQGRQVFAIPGDIQNQQVAGCHHLIREGAQLVSHPREVLDAIFWTEPRQLELVRTQEPSTRLTDMEKKMLAALDRTPRHLDIIQARTECELTLVLETLFSLELKGMIISSIDGYYKPNQGDTC